MPHHSRTPRRRGVVPLLALGGVVFAACGTESTTSNSAPTTLSVPAADGDVSASSPDTESTDSANTEVPSDTITPPESSAPVSDATVPDTTPLGEPVDTDEPTATTPTTPGTDVAALTPTQQALADIAIADIVDRRGVEAAAVEVISVDEVTWPDSSRGCPQRGMQYQQVLTPGIRVVLDAAGQRAFYHGTSTRDLAYCAAPTSPVGG